MEIASFLNMAKEHNLGERYKGCAIGFDGRAGRLIYSEGGNRTVYFENDCTMSLVSNRDTMDSSTRRKLFDNAIGCYRETDSLGIHMFSDHEILVITSWFSDSAYAQITAADRSYHDHDTVYVASYATAPYHLNLIYRPDSANSQKMMDFMERQCTVRELEPHWYYYRSF